MLILSFNKIKEYFKREIWNKEMVKNAVEKQKITETEYKEITSEDYTK
ncbi:XkdX family protein [Metaclostridioides mangenotii]|uniref:XkdX family phage protein n=1 Tax=Metaclostridioides mangenotii TaxID=1540 RepID=A0ABS4EE05_9FIRM|nr:XkdX family protein [Clostridioides mangenotii]MBP1856169.1 putative XkdX family phage protein [Clostridioides mangenotii]